MGTYYVEYIKIEYQVHYKQLQDNCIHVSVIHTHVYMYQDSVFGM